MYETLQTVGWLGDLMSLVGAYHIAGRSRNGYAWFMASCPLLAAPAAYGHVWNQVALLAAYFTIDLIGWVKWKNS